MDEWSVLTRLQDYEAQKKMQLERETARQKRLDMVEMLRKQKEDQEMRRREHKKRELELEV